MTKKIRLLLIILILLLGLLPTKVLGQAYNVPNQVRVALKYESTSLNEVETYSNTGLDLGTYINKEFSPLISIEDDSKVKLVKDSSYHLQIGQDFESYEEIVSYISLLLAHAGEDFHISIFPLYNGNWIACSSFYSELPIMGVNLSDHGLDEYKLLYNIFSNLDLDPENIYQVSPYKTERFAMRVEHQILPLLVVSDPDNKSAISLKAKDSSTSEPPLLRFFDNTIIVPGNEFRARYRGYFDIHRQASNSGDNFVLVNRLGLEEYLYSVLPAEMSPGISHQDYIDRIEALKVQAITARTFAVRYIEAEAYGKYWADIEDTTTTQVYGGYTRVINNKGETRDGEYPNGNAAVDLTRGQVLTYNGQLASSVFYHSNSGGYTESPQNVWGSSTSPAYVVSKADPYTNPRLWSGSYTGSSLSNTFRQYVLSNESVDLGTIKYVNVISRSQAGRITGSLIEGSKASFTVRLEKNRWMLSLGTSGLMYNYEVNDKIKIIYQADGSDKLLSQRARKVLEGNYFTRQFIDDQYGVIGNDNYLYERIKVYDSSLQTIKVNGKGTGHGIGMSQDGATNMSKQGISYLEILNFYFPGIEVSGKIGD